MPQPQPQPAQHGSYDKLSVCWTRLQQLIQNATKLACQLACRSGFSSSGDHHLAPWQVVKGPVTKHLPVGAERVGFTRTADATAKIPGFVDELRWQAGSPVLVLGAMAHGQLDITYIDR